MNPSSRSPRSDIVGQPSRRYWLNVAKWSVLILLVFELAVRIFVMRLPPHEYKPEWGLVPAEGSSSVQGREGYGVLHYFANGEIRTPYQDGEAVVVLGDSTVQAAQVNDSENFVSLTEEALRQRGIKADLHNLGGSERTMADHIFFAPAVRQYFSPKVVVVQVSPATFSLAFYAPKDNHFIENEDGSLVLVHRTSSAEGLGSRNFFFSSGLLSLFDFRWQITSEEMIQHYGNIRFGSGGEAAAAGRGNPQSSGDDGEEKSRARIILLANELRDAYPDSEIVFLVIPYTPSLEPGPKGKISWVSGEDRQLAVLLSSIEDVQVVYVQKSFEQFYKKYSVLPRGSFNSLFNFGHLNEYGHEAVAQTLTDALETILK